MTAVKEGTQFHEELRESVRNVCSKYPDAYWRELDANWLIQRNLLMR